MYDERKGVSLAKGPVAILGAVLLGYGILAMILGNNSFRVVDVPDGPITYGERFLALEGNGWTNLLWIGAGGLLLLGSALHWGAKLAAAVGGLALGAASLISLVTQWSDGNWGVFGVFAANNWTTLAWGAAALVLLAIAVLPRKRGRERRFERGPIPSRSASADRDRIANSTAPRRAPVSADRATSRERIGGDGGRDRAA